ncbi:MAG: hypothetical protein ACRCTS_02880 [Fusobacteriaceae bacterium]
MKKILLVGAFLISAVSFANVHANHNMGNMNNGAAAMGTMQGGSGMMGGKMGMMKGEKCSMMGGKGMMMNMTPEQRMAMEKDMITMKEKQLEVRKLMNTTNPDMKKVEAVNIEIAKMRTKHMESMNKMMAVPATPVKTN